MITIEQRSTRSVEGRARLQTGRLRNTVEGNPRG
jgi:hypothetical protein